jgi:glycosyltransferase involved in cell wall biosynthesis
MILNIVSPQLGIRSDARLGGEIVSFQVLSALAKLKHKIHIIVPNRQRTASQSRWSINSLHLPFIYPPHLFNYLFPLKLKKLINLNNVVFYSHSIVFTAPGLIKYRQKYQLKIPLINNLQLLSDLNLLSNPEIILNQLDHLVVPSHYLKNQLKKITATPVTVIPNGIATCFHPLKSKSKSKYFRLLFVGQLIPRKNPLFLLKIINQLPSNFHLTIIGQGPLAPKLGHPRIKIIPFVPHYQLAKYYQQADLFLFPSEEEGFGLTVAEAQACGLPALVADNSSLPERIDDQRTGFALLLDLQTWVRKIKDLEKKPLKFKPKTNSWSGTAKQIAKIYEDLIPR